MTTNKTIVFFHTGRGGRYYNGGHTTFCGTKNIGEVLSMNDSGKRHSFLNKENYFEVYKKVENLDNLKKLLEDCTDKGDYSEFENKTGLDLGEDIYTDCNGVQIITAAEVEAGTGTLNWDNEYDTDTCIYLSDCGKDELQMIADSGEWNKESLLQEYFDSETDLKIDWEKFNGDYTNLIDGYFDDTSFDITDFYEEEKLFNIIATNIRTGEQVIEKYDFSEMDAQTWIHNNEKSQPSWTFTIEPAED